MMIPVITCFLKHLKVLAKRMPFPVAVLAPVFYCDQPVNPELKRKGIIF
jgi:hypothetical protein